MMMLINCFSLIAILVSILIMVLHPKIKFPIHVDVVMLIIAIGTVAIFINTVLGTDLYGQMHNAEIWIRFGFACLTMRYVYQSAGVENNEND